MKFLISVLLLFILSSPAMSNSYELVGCIVAGSKSVAVLKSDSETLIVKLNQVVGPNVTVTSIAQQRATCKVTLSNGLDVPQIQGSEESTKPAEKEQQKVEDLRNAGVKVDNLDDKEVENLLDDVKFQVQLDEKAKEEKSADQNTKSDNQSQAKGAQQAGPANK